MPKVFDVFPFFNELDVLEIRLNEMHSVVDTTVIVESLETYGGDRKPMYFHDNRARFKKFDIKHVVLDKLAPPQNHRLDRNEPGVTIKQIRDIGRAREADQRNRILPVLKDLSPAPDDVIIFSDCDEIPRATAVWDALPNIATNGIHRLKQRSFYYTVNCLVDYGRDVCSRARVGRFSDLEACGSMYDFRMYRGKDPECPAIEDGGWHFSYFCGGLAGLKTKVAALAPFLAEYKLFGDKELAKDVVNRKDLHHRPTGFSELAETFAYAETTDPTLPKYFLDNTKRFEHFTEEFYKRECARLLR